MTTNKLDQIKNSLFKGRQKVMAGALGVSQSKISDVLSGKLKLTEAEIGILLTQYHIDPYWLWDEDDSTEVKFSHAEAPKNEVTYEIKELIKQQTVLMEQMAAYNRELRDGNERLKNDTVPDAGQ